MSLFALQESDLEHTLEDPNGFGRAIELTPPEGEAKNFFGNSGDIAQMIDLETGQAVSGRLVHVSLRISSLTAAGLSIPLGVADKESKPWLVKFKDVNLTDHTFKVLQASPDTMMGMVHLNLGVYVE